MDVKLTIDGVEIQAAEGMTILQAADAGEIYIPRLCSHPDLPSVSPETLEPWEEVYQGAVQRRSEGPATREDAGYEGCQLCVVTVEGRSEPARACATQVEEGMRISTKGAEIESHRRSRLKEIFATHPHACVQCAQRAGCALEPCSTNVAKEERCCPIFHTCELRKVAEHIGIPSDTPRYRPAGLPIVDSEPLFLRDHNLCIGCLRCVRMCRDVRKIDALGFVMDEGGRPVVGARAPTLFDSNCNFCLSCVEVCPTGSLRLKFDEPRRDGERVASCAASCPAGMDIPRYLREIRRGDFARAEAVIRESAPLPRVLGQVCFRPCEDACLRDDVSEAVAICSLKRAALEHSGEPLWKSRLEPHPPTGKKVAIVGAGPAGLTASWFLKLKGHDVALFDSQPSPGGWLRNGIPPHRLDRRALQADVADIADLGVEFKMGMQVGKDVTIDALRSDHDAVFIAAGARKGKSLPCEGAELSGVESGLDVLERLAGEDGFGDRPYDGDTVVVIGGGNVAMDVARTALRLGPREVHVYCLEERGEMPAHAWEIREAEEEGIVMHPGWGPKRITGGGKVEQVDFRKCTSVFDDGGRFAPEFDETVTASQEAQRVLIAIGQEAVLDFVEGIDRSGAGTLIVDGSSMQTSVAGVFAGGEVVSGPSSVVEAIEQGRRAASGIDSYLGGDGNVDFRLVDEAELDGELGGIERFASLPRTPEPRLPVQEAVGCFTLVETGYTPEHAMREASRCLRCDLRLHSHSVPLPPESWLDFTEENVSALPESEGVYQLLDEGKVVYAIKGVDNLRSALSEIVQIGTKAKFFLYEEDPMYSKRESELIQDYLREHGCMPPGEGEDDLDDLF